MGSMDCINKIATKSWAISKRTSEKEKFWNPIGRFNGKTFKVY